MKLFLCIILSSVILFSCSGKNVKESSDDIASISDEELIGDDPLMSSDTEISNNDDEIASIEDDLLLEEKSSLQPVQDVVETKEVEEITNNDVNESISMDDELVPTELSEPTSPSPNQGVSGLMVLDTETQEWIPANQCVHIIKNDVYKEPTCLKRR